MKLKYTIISLGEESQFLSFRKGDLIKLADENNEVPDGVLDHAREQDKLGFFLLNVYMFCLPSQDHPMKYWYALIYPSVCLFMFTCIVHRLYLLMG